MLASGRKSAGLANRGRPLGFMPRLQLCVFRIPVVPCDVINRTVVEKASNRRPVPFVPAVASVPSMVEKKPSLHIGPKFGTVSKKAVTESGFAYAGDGWFKKGCCQENILDIIRFDSGFCQCLRRFRVFKISVIMTCTSFAVYAIIQIKD
jgi:hypothetical protein